MNNFLLKIVCKHESCWKICASFLLFYTSGNVLVGHKYYLRYVSFETLIDTQFVY